VNSNNLHKAVLSQLEQFKEFSPNQYLERLESIVVVLKTQRLAATPLMYCRTPKLEKAVNNRLDQWAERNLADK